MSTKPKFSCISQFFLQLRIIMWKNATLRIRFWSVLLLELAIPSIFMLALFGIRNTIKSNIIEENIPSSIYDSQSPTFREMHSTPDWVGENLLWRCVLKKIPSTSFNDSASNYCQARQIAIAPSSASAASDAMAFKDWAIKNYPLKSTSSSASDSFFKYFDSESAFLNYINADRYGFDNSIPIYSAAIILNSGYPAWDYSIRMNRTFTSRKIVARNRAGSAPLTNTAVTDESLLYNSQIPGNSSFAPYVEMYANIGYFALTDLINSYITTKTCQIQNKCTNTENVILRVPGVVNFPSSQVTALGFWSLIGGLFGLFMILGLLYPIANAIKALVQEKETKIPSISYSIFISTIFSTSRSASIIGSLIYFGGYFIYVGLSSGSPSRTTLLLSSLHPSAAFTFGTLAFAEYEDNQIGITQFTINKSNKYQITFADTLGLLVVDTLYLLVLSWYLAHVMPSEFGTPKKWYFCFLPSYWLPNVFRNNHHNGRETGLEQANTADDEDCPVEGVTENLASQKTNSKCVEIIGLRKEFQTNTGLKVAVDGLNLTMYNGQITALLGHNGAGKSTAIAMLTGLIPSDGGVALVE
eukprot:gene10963-22907_t